MTFYWFDLLQLIIYISLAFLGYKLYKKKKYKSVIAIVVFIVITFFLSPVNITKDGYGSVESSQFNSFSSELPEKIRVEKHTKSFEERVKEDIQSYKEERNNEDD